MARRIADVQDGPGFFDDDASPAAASATKPPRPASGRRLVVEADGGSRGNPGPAAYGALVWDAVTGEVLMSEGLSIGVATNNVAEYSGLIAGLEMAREIDPGAAVEVRMDSKLVVEQMAGRWKIKHPAMKPLAGRAQQLRPPSVTWTWVPRELNKRADALVNSALDGVPVPRPGSATGSG
jgi:ribonuclease HI